MPGKPSIWVFAADPWGSKTGCQPMNKIYIVDGCPWHCLPGRGGWVLEF